MAFITQRFSKHAYAIMRIMTGLLFLWHGTGKLFGFPGGPHGDPPPAHITYIAGPIELVGGILVLIGLFTRPAAFVCSGLMAAAYWMAHGTDNLFPVLNKGELAVLYCFVFLFISAQGGGKWSVDSLLSRPKD